MTATLRLADRFVLGELLGAGGMGEVYAAYDERDARHVAVKRLHAGSERHPELVARLAREGALLRATAHPNIVAVLGVYEADAPCIVMELVPGGSLADLLRREPQLPVDRVLTLALDVCDALARAHRLGIVHCDVKPANVLLAEDGTPRLTDFGVAELFDTTADGAPAAARGTLPYMSPERWDAEPAEPRDDVWALGVMLYEMLAGRRPFEGVSAGMLLASIMMSEPPRLQSLRAEVPTALDDAIARMLRKDPATRMQSVRELALVVERLLRPGSVAPITESTSGATVRRGALPTYATPLVGRDALLDHVCALVLRDDVRLVTLSGPGGVGKTRLAVEAAARVAERFADGVTFVNLTPESEPARVLQSVAQALGVEEDLYRPLVELIAERLATRPHLLVLDNFEQLLDAASDVALLLSHAPALTVVVTSRFLLHIGAEHEVRVPPLELHVTSGAARDGVVSDAVRLFLDRAAIADPRLVVGGDVVATITEICRRLDGIPLALELAAARVRTVPPAQLLALLDAPLSLLTGGSRERAPHQRTLRATVQWSYELLDARDQTLFRRLAPFVGGFSLDDAFAVLGGSDAAPDLPTLVDGLHSLLEKNLVTRAAGGAEPRYDMLMTLRAYARERLDEDDDAAEWDERHARHFLARAEEWDAQVPTMRQGDALGRFADAHGNLTVALEWMTRHDPDALARAVGSLGRYWYFAGLWTEALGWYRRALALAPADAYLERATLLDQRARLEMFLGDETSARSHHEQAAALAIMSRDELTQARTREGLGEILLKVGESQRAWELLDAALTSARAVGDVGTLALTLTTFATADVALGSPAVAAIRLGEALELATLQGDRALITKIRYYMAGLALLDGDAKTARFHCEAGKVAALDSGDRSWACHLDEMFGRVLVMEHDWSGAAALTWESLHSFHALGSRACLPHSFEAAARLCLARAAGREADDATLEEAAHFVDAADGVCEALAISMFPVERALLEQTRRSLHAAMASASARAVSDGASHPRWSEAEAVERARLRLGAQD